jgi:hypothetical protein
MPDMTTLAEEPLRTEVPGAGLCPITKLRPKGKLPAGTPLNAYVTLPRS